MLRCHAGAWRAIPTRVCCRRASLPPQARPCDLAVSRLPRFHRRREYAFGALVAGLLRSGKVAGSAKVEVDRRGPCAVLERRPDAHQGDLRRTM
ncbi:MAG TPA: hypothetical protein DHV85_07525 [Candidatus Accumulibacter sp.]|nr:hypothetical protein [Accumulibacter sp.]